MQDADFKTIEVNSKDIRLVFSPFWFILRFKEFIIQTFTELNTPGSFLFLG